MASWLKKRPARADAIPATWPDLASLTPDERRDLATRVAFDFAEAFDRLPGPPSRSEIAAAIGPAYAVGFRGAVRGLAQAGAPASMLQALTGLDEPDRFAAFDVLKLGISKAWIEREADIAFGYITAIPLDQIREIPGLVEDAIVSGRRWQTVAGAIEERVDVGARHAELIARDQIAKVNAQITRELHEKAGIVEYTWRAGSDERVRASHRAVNGKVWRYDTGAPGVAFGGGAGNPGEAGQCRCTAEPVIPATW